MQRAERSHEVEDFELLRTWVETQAPPLYLEDAQSDRLMRAGLLTRVHGSICLTAAANALVASSKTNPAAFSLRSGPVR